jgi:F420-0:gamma-glutamyl ligase
VYRNVLALATPISPQSSSGCDQANVEEMTAGLFSPTLRNHAGGRITVIKTDLSSDCPWLTGATGVGLRLAGFVIQ